VFGFAERRYAADPLMNTYARPAEGAKGQKQDQRQKPKPKPKPKPDQKIAAAPIMGLVYTRPSPLNRPSVSSPAAVDLALPAPSGG